MTVFLINSSYSARKVGDIYLAPGAVIEIETITPEASSQITTGDLDIGTIPYNNDYVRPDNTYPKTDISGSIKAGVTGHGAITGGSMGTNGTFSLGFTGGTGTAAVGTFTVTGGSLTSITITSTGAYSVVPTAFDFSASAGLSGASASVVSATITSIMSEAISSRKGWTFKNTSSEIMYVDDSGSTASASSPTSKSVLPGESISSIPGFASVSALSVYGSTLGQTYSATQW